MKTGYIVGVVLFVVVISIVAGSLGMIPEPEFIHDIDTTMPGILQVLQWMWGAFLFFILLVTWQIPGVPAVINALITFPLMAGLIYIIGRAVRGGG